MNSKQKILYVDDEQINLILFERYFADNFEVLTAFNGAEGLDELENNPDTLVIISDLNMPGMNGLEFIQKAKATYPEKKFYILTDFDITDEIHEALSTGLIIKHFRKSIEIKKMYQLIEKAIK